MAERLEVLLEGVVQRLYRGATELIRGRREARTYLQQNLIAARRTIFYFVSIDITMFTKNARCGEDGNGDAAQLKHMATIDTR